MTSNNQHPEHQYLDLLEDIMENGVEKISHSTGMGLKSVFGRQMRFDLSKGFPLLTTKRVFFRGIVHELLWFISGSSNISYLTRNNVHIWDDWGFKNYSKAAKKGDVPEITIDEFSKKIQTDDEFAKVWGEIEPAYRDWETNHNKIGRAHV